MLEIIKNHSLRQVVILKLFRFEQQKSSTLVNYKRDSFLLISNFFMTEPLSIMRFGNISYYFVDLMRNFSLHCERFEKLFGAFAKINNQELSIQVLMLGFICLFLLANKFSESTVKR